jgi:Xaa-Pro aminopeptidase
MNERRLEAVRQRLNTLRLDALLVTLVPHVQYLTGFTGSNGLAFISKRNQWFFTDGRYSRQSQEEVRGFKRVVSGRGLFRDLQRTVRPGSGSRIGIDRRHLSVTEMENLRHLFPKVRFVSGESIVDGLASVKDSSEIGLIKAAIAITEKVFRQLLQTIRVGMSELDIAAEIVYLHRRFGADADAFEPIVASGKRGALPHARPTAKRIRNGELVTLDCGCRYRGYHSDLTRTISVGRISPERRRLYTVVRDAQQLALDSARDGMTGKELDAVARRHIKQKKLGKYFPHSLGHGLGLQVHESPRVSSLSTDVLEAGNVITIEPGVYVPGVGGVRIEDDIVIRKGGSELLTSISKELITL